MNRIWRETNTRDNINTNRKRLNKKNAGKYGMKQKGNDSQEITTEKNSKQ